MAFSVRPIGPSEANWHKPPVTNSPQEKLVAIVDGAKGPYDGKIENPLVLWGRNAAANNMAYLNQYANGAPLKFHLQYSPDGKAQPLAAVANGYEELLNIVAKDKAEFKKTGAISLQEFDSFMQSAFGDSVSAAAMDVNRDKKIDIGEYSTTFFLSDMLTKGSPMQLKNLTGTMSEVGQNASLPYTAKANYEVAKDDLAYVHNFFKLDDARKEFMSNPNNLVD